MVKWMEEIEVAESESDNHYHFMDNRVLPSHVDEATAKEEGKPLNCFFPCSCLKHITTIFSCCFSSASQFLENLK